MCLQIETDRWKQKVDMHHIAVSLLEGLVCTLQHPFDGAQPVRCSVRSLLSAQGLLLCRTHSI